MNAARIDAEICRDIVEELRWTPSVDENDIAVKVSQGIVTLTGSVPSLAERYGAERAVKRIPGVRALANDLQIRPNSAGRRSDSAIARSVAEAIEHELPYSAHLIRIVVEDGAVRLEGVVDWEYQKLRAEEATRTVRGVGSIANLLTLKTKPMARDIKERIDAALTRAAQMDAEHIQVEIEDDEVTLSGRVRSWAEHEAAAECAGSVPGVGRVRNNISVGP